MSIYLKNQKHVYGIYKTMFLFFNHFKLKNDDNQSYKIVIASDLYINL